MMNAKKKEKSERNQKVDENKEENEDEENEVKIKSLHKAGEIAKEVKSYIRPKIKIGAKALEIIESTEDKIKELGGSCAFPVNLCINNIAAHYTSPMRDDDLTIHEDDIVKIDLGVHIEGYIVDTAFSISFNEDPDLENLVQSTEVAVEGAIMMAKPEVNTREIGKKIEEIIKGFNYNPIKELGGHQVEKWKVHGTKAFPNYGSQHGDPIEEGDIFAVEIFASTGVGSVHNTNNSYIYEQNPYSGRVPLRRKSSKKILGYINQNYKTLPFAERWLAKEFRMGVAFGLQELIQQGKITSHHVLSEKKGAYVAQSEETIVITEDGYEKLT